LGALKRRSRGGSIFEMLVDDKTGSVKLTFFNQPYLRRTYKEGAELVIYGQVIRDSYSNGRLIFVNPECEMAASGSGISPHTGRVVPIYRKLADMRTRQLRQVIFTALSGLSSEAPELLPSYLMKKLRLMSRLQALKGVHFPELRSLRQESRAMSLDTLNRGVSAAHKRLIFGELFQLQVAIMMAREQRRGEKKGRRITLGEPLRQALKKILPFHPTEAQKRVLREIAADLRSSRPMSRLLQGDVGSGKTIVAAQAAVICVENRFQAAIMAPTEVLAEQHFFNFRRLLEPIRYQVDLLKGSMRAKPRRETLRRIEIGETQVVIGTHALIQDAVEFGRLGLVVIDEQHRFGVTQRNMLRKKGGLPDVLVMTATPIPRSLAMTLYGDLDVSVIDELPPGRKPIETLQYSEKRRSELYQEMGRELSQGHQIYVVYPLVEETARSDLRAATEMAALLSGHIFPQHTVGLLHGKMKGEEKDSVMTEFAAGDIDILVATTVIEVGIDVANATLMVVEHAERFGLAQLHQLRGRVGRGPSPSRCILIGNPKGSQEARRRLDTMCETNDGFRIAEVDLELRGPGEIAGTRQSGLPLFKYADLARDMKALAVAREEAERFLTRLKKRPDRECSAVAEFIRREWREKHGPALAS
jgi:ATP-dependent DNA helicase RecG